ncbi:MAG: hypothetical protein V1837_05980 [Candidatus Woesearchaeota archaeon]
MESIRVKCRVCGKQVRTDELVLDPVYRKMVCQNCVNDRKQREQVHAEVKAQSQAAKDTKKDSPAGWDREDEYLQRIHKQKMDDLVRVQWIDKNTVKYICQKCAYQFKINVEKNMPSNCPYCSTAVKKFA